MQSAPGFGDCHSRTISQFDKEEFQQVNRKIKNSSTSALVLISILALMSSAHSQTARVALDTYDEGPVWQIMKFRTGPGKTEVYLKNIATVWELQLKLAVEKGVLNDYKVLTKWASDPDDWNIMVIEIFPDMASYDTFWEDWAEIDTETVDTPEFQERFDRMEDSGTQFLGTVFAREVRLKPQ
jgi:hypothetical protein